jgi:sugar-specific transcriptional regulator TrmB
MAYIYGREVGPNEKVYSAADYEALEKKLKDEEDSDLESLGIMRRIRDERDKLKAEVAELHAELEDMAEEKERQLNRAALAEKAIVDNNRSMMQKMDEADGEAVSAYRKLLYKIDALKAALVPFAKFEVPTDMRQKNYRGAVYTTTMISGQSTALTVDDFDSAREALEEKP